MSGQQQQLSHQRIPHPHHHHHHHHHYHHHHHHHLQQQQQHPQPNPSVVLSSHSQKNRVPHAERFQQLQPHPQSPHGNASVSTPFAKHYSGSASSAAVSNPNAFLQTKGTAPFRVKVPRADIPLLSVAEVSSSTGRSTGTKVNASGKVAHHAAVKPSPVFSSTLEEKQTLVQPRGPQGNVQLTSEMRRVSPNHFVPGANRTGENASVMQRQRPQASTSRNTSAMQRNAPRAQGPPLVSQPSFPPGKENRQTLSSPQRPVRSDLQKQPRVHAPEQSASRPPHPVTKTKKAPTESSRAAPSLFAQSHSDEAPRELRSLPLAERPASSLQLSPDVQLRDDLADAGVAPSTSVRAAQDGNAVQQLLPLESRLQRFSALLCSDSEEDSSGSEKQSAAVEKGKEGNAVPVGETLTLSSETRTASSPSPERQEASKPSAAVSSSQAEKRGDDNENNKSSEGEKDDDEIGMTSDMHVHESLSKKNTKQQLPVLSPVPTSSTARAAEAETGTTPIATAECNDKPLAKSPKKTNSDNDTGKHSLLAKASVGVQESMTDTMSSAVGPKVKEKLQSVSSDITPHRRAQNGPKGNSRNGSEDEEHVKPVKSPTRGKDSTVRYLCDSPSQHKDARRLAKKEDKRSTKNNLHFASLLSPSPSLSLSDDASLSFNENKKKKGSKRISEDQKKESPSLLSASCTPSPHTTHSKRREYLSPKSLFFPQRLHDDHHHHHHKYNRNGSNLEKVDISRPQEKTPLRSRRARLSSRGSSLPCSLSDSQIFRTNDVYTLYRELCRQQVQRPRSRRFSAGCDFSLSAAAPWRHTSPHTHLLPAAPPLRRPFGYISRNISASSTPHRRSAMAERKHSVRHPYELLSPLSAPFSPDAETPLRRFARDTFLSPARKAQLSPPPPPPLRANSHSLRRCCSETREIDAAKCFGDANRVPIPVVDMRKDFRPRIVRSVAPPESAKRRVGLFSPINRPSPARRARASLDISPNEKPRAARYTRGAGDFVIVEEVRLDEQRRPYVLIREIPHGKAARESQKISVERLSRPRAVVERRGEKV